MQSPIVPRSLVEFEAFYQKKMLTSEGSMFCKPFYLAVTVLTKKLVREVTPCLFFWLVVSWSLPPSSVPAFTSFSSGKPRNKNTSRTKIPPSRWTNCKNFKALNSQNGKFLSAIRLKISEPSIFLTNFYCLLHKTMKQKNCIASER